MIVTPLSITNLQWQLADASYALGEDVHRSFTRTADRAGFRLDTPQGQFKLLESFVGATASAALFQIVVIATMPLDEWELLQSSIPSEITVAPVHSWMEKHVQLEAVVLSGTLRDWYRLDMNLRGSRSKLYDLVRGVKIAVEPSKIWTLCNNIY